MSTFNMSTIEQIERLNLAYAKLMTINERATHQILLNKIKIGLSKSLLDMTAEEQKQIENAGLFAWTEEEAREDVDTLLRLQLKQKIEKLEKNKEQVMVSEPITNSNLLRIISAIVETKPHLADLFECLKDGEKGLHLFYGDIQSGKTATCLYNAWMSVSLGKTAIILTENMISHTNQMYNDCVEFEDGRLKKEFAWLEEKYGELKGLQSSQFNAFFKYDVTRDDENNIIDRKVDMKYFNELVSKKENTDMKNWYDFLDPTNPKTGVIVVNVNSSKLSLLWFFIDLLDSQYSLIVDEVDKVHADENDNSRKLNIYLSKIINKSSMITGTTATPLKIFMNKHSGLTNVKEIPRSVNYVGLDDLIWNTSLFENDKAVSSRKKVFSELPHLAHFINKESMRLPTTVSIEGQKHILPNITALVVSDNVKHHQEIHNHIKENKYDNNIVSITWNGQGLRLYSSALARDKINEVKLFNTSKDKGIKMFKSNSPGEFYIDTTKNIISVSHVFDFLRNNGGYYRFGNIFVSGGKYFDRAIKYVDTQYLWHITKELLLLSPTVAADKAIQYLRILGVFRDKGQYTPTIVTSKKIKEKLNTAYTIGRQSTKQLSNHNDIKNIDNFIDLCTFSGAIKNTSKMFNVAKGVNITNKFKSKNFCMNGADQVNWAFQTNNEYIQNKLDEMYDTTHKKGFTFKKIGAFKRDKLKEKIQEVEDLDDDILSTLVDEVDHIKVETNQKESNIEQRGLIMLAKAYENKSGKVHKIINAFVANGNSALSSEELKMICNIKVLSDYAIWNLQKGRYKIVTKTISGKWVLHQVVIDYLKLNV